jgi:DNA-binding beta-propeller fold protein YncE
MALVGTGLFTYEASGENWGSLPEGLSYREATALALDSHDNVHVFNRGSHPMIVLDPQGSVLRTWGEGGFVNPHGVAIGPDDSVYCVDFGDHTVRKFDPQGKLLMTIGDPGKPALPMSGEPFSSPTHVAVDQRNADLYVSDGYSNARVHKYSPDGRHLLSWGESGTDEGQFSVPHGIATDRDGWVYVADRENQRIQIFDSNGSFEAQWGLNLSRPGCVHIDHGSGTMLAYVGEFFGGFSTNSTGMRLGPRVSILDSEGKVLARLGDQTFGDEAGRFYSPHAIAVDSRGDIYLAEVPRTESYGGLIPPLTDPAEERRSLQKLVKRV